MTEVEKFILENQAKILMTLATMHSDRVCAKLAQEAADITIAQIAEWEGAGAR